MQNNNALLALRERTQRHQIDCNITSGKGRETCNLQQRTQIPRAFVAQRGRGSGGGRSVARTQEEGQRLGRVSRL